MVFAEPSIRVDNAYFERDLMLLVIAIVTLILFNVLRSKTEGIRIRPIGRRITDLAKLNARINLEHEPDKEVIPFAYTDWEPTEQAGFWVMMPERFTRWRISMFSVSRVSLQERFDPSLDGLFMFARTKEEMERVVSPLQRKIVARYRSQFTSVSVMHLSPPTDEDSSYTWLPNDAAVWNAILGFLDECLAISDSLDCDPQLSICRGLCFWIEVEWPAKNAAEWIQRIGAENPELEVTSEDGNFGLRLHISFPQSLVPQAVQAAQKRTA